MAEITWTKNAASYMRRAGELILVADVAAGTATSGYLEFDGFTTCVCLSTQIMEDPDDANDQIFVHVDDDGGGESGNKIYIEGKTAVNDIATQMVAWRMVVLCKTVDSQA